MRHVSALTFFASNQQATSERSGSPSEENSGIAASSAGVGVSSIEAPTYPAGRPCFVASPDRYRPSTSSTPLRLRTVREDIPLLTLLSWAWIAFTIEVDNAFEAQSAESTGSVFRISLPMW